MKHNYFLRGAPVDRPELADWHWAEAELGAALPTDYKEFIDQYGAGCVATFIWIYSPRAAGREMELVFNLRQLREERDAVHAIFPDTDEEFPLFPDPGGILRWGHTFNGEDLSWLVKDPRRPDEWPVVITGGRMPGHEIFDVRATDLLWSLVTGETTSKFFGNLSDEPLRTVFVPYSKRAQ